MKHALLALLLTFSLAAGASAAQDEVIAKIADKTVTVADFERLVAFFSEQSRRDLSNDQQFVQSLFDGMVKRLTLLELAKRKGLDKQKGVWLLMDFAAGNVLSSELISQEVGQKANVTEEEMLTYYKINQKEFQKPASARVRQILIKTAKSDTEETRKKAKSKAEEILKRIKSGESFVTLATELSDDTVTKEKGGDIGYIPQGKYGKEVDDAVFKMKAGEVSDVLGFPDGYRIFLVEDKKEGFVEPFNSVKDKVRQGIIAQTRKGTADELFEKAKKELGVEVHPEFLSAKKDEKSHK